MSLEGTTLALSAARFFSTDTTPSSSKKCYGQRDESRMRSPAPSVKKTSASFTTPSTTTTRRSVSLLSHDQEPWPFLPIQLGQSLLAEGEEGLLEIALCIFQTCLKFHPRTSGDKNWINIRPLGGCFSRIGKSWSAGSQDLSLGFGCVHHGPPSLHPLSALSSHALS